MFCNVDEKAVIPFPDLDHAICNGPLFLRKHFIDRIVVARLGIDVHNPDLSDWESFVNKIIHPEKSIKIAVAGKYISLQDAYKSIYESLTIAGAHHSVRIETVKLDPEELEEKSAEELIGDDISGILIPGGFGDRGTEGKIIAAQYARENNIPFFGICLGMQVAAIEYARNVCELPDAYSTEFKPDCQHPIVDLQDSQKKITDKGASMRLGAHETRLVPGTLASKVYGEQETISERHRHRYEFNPTYRDVVQEKGLVISGVDTRQDLVEIIEVPEHPFYLAVQFHPEFKSKPNHPHPVFASFIEASMAYAEQ